MFIRDIRGSKIVREWLQVIIRKEFNESTYISFPILWAVEFGKFRLMFYLGTECGGRLKDIVNSIHSCENPNNYDPTDETLKIFERLKLSFNRNIAQKENTSFNMEF